MLRPGVAAVVDLCHGLVAEVQSRALDSGLVRHHRETHEGRRARALALPFSIEYDLGGTIWGGGHFTVIKGALYFNERPCLPLQPVGY